ncbi:hypothetical protein MJO29_003580 [Puccinia striiformis f. sp. tritici]|nr:hypothetical protein MJO29_003580 [Puccinia striiformis f. sp. tritici]
MPPSKHPLVVPSTDSKSDSDSVVVASGPSEASAYLNATSEEDETVYMHIPEGFKEWLIETKPETPRKQNIDNFLRGGNNDYIMKLKKSPYGLKRLNHQPKEDLALGHGNTSSARRLTVKCGTCVRRH